MRKTILLFLAISLGACATTALAPDEISVVEKSYGLYKMEPKMARLLETTDLVPCRQGTSFGAELLLTFENPRKATIPVRIQWQTPEVEGVRPAQRTFPETDPTIDGKAHQVMFSVIDTFGDPRMLVPGDYVLRVINRKSSDAYYERRFRVQDCQ